MIELGNIIVQANFDFMVRSHEKREGNVFVSYTRFGESAMIPKDSG